MSIEVSYTEARANLARPWDLAVANREPIIIRRRDNEDMAMMPSAELASLMETARLLRSPRNAEKLLSALARARNAEGQPASADLL